MTQRVESRTTGRRPLALFIAGPPASGKTTFAVALAPALRAALLDLDVATGPLTKLVLDLIGATDLSERRAAELTRASRYETLLGLAADTARGGTSSVVAALSPPSARPPSGPRSRPGWHPTRTRTSSG